KPQPVREALEAFGRQTGLQVMFRSEDVSTAGVTTAGISGKLSPREALNRLLASTGLTFEFINEHTVRISAVATSTVTGAGPAVGRADDLQVAQRAVPTAGATSYTAGEQPRVTPDGQQIGEIIVTAQKRTERLQDVPVPVTSLAADTLIDNNGLRLRDYYTS